MTNISKISRKLLLAIIFISLFSACSSKVKPQKVIKEKAYKYASVKDGVLHLDLDKSRKDSSIMNLSEVCDSLIYIPLETKKECLLGRNLNEFYMDGDEILLQINTSAYHFKRSGEFVCQFGRRGRGPGEYVCTDFAVNKEEKKVYAHSIFGHRIFEFNYDGKLLSSKVRTKEGQTCMLYSPKDKSLIYTSSYVLSLDKDIKSDKYTMLNSFDLKGKQNYNLKSKYFPKKFFDEGKGARVVLAGVTKYLMNNSLYFQELASDTVFRKNNDSLIPHIILNNSEFRKPFKSSRFKSDVKTRMVWFIDGSPKFPLKVCGESSRFVFIDCSAEPAYVYDKKERILTCVKYHKEEIDGKKKGEKKTIKYVYVNDIDGINHIEETRIVDNKYLFSKISAIDFLENLEKLKASVKVNNKYLARLEKIAEGMTVESNPVIMLARIKK